MAAPAYQASGSVASHATNSISPGWPTHQAGDIGLLVVNKPIYYDTWSTLSTPNGFKSLVRWSTSNVLVQLFWCPATSNAMSAPTVSGNTDAFGTAGIIHTFRGCDVQHPIIPGRYTGGITPATSLATAAGNGSCVVPKLLTDSLFVAVISTPASSITLSTYSGSNLSSITERFDGSMTYGSGHVITAVPGSDDQNGPLVATLSGSNYAVYFPLIFQAPVSSSYSRSRVVNNG